MVWQPGFFAHCFLVAPTRITAPPGACGYIRFFFAYTEILGRQERPAPRVLVFSVPSGMAMPVSGGGSQNFSAPQAGVGRFGEVDRAYRARRRPAGPGQPPGSRPRDRQGARWSLPRSHCRAVRAAPVKAIERGIHNPSLHSQLGGIPIPFPVPVKMEALLSL